MRSFVASLKYLHSKRFIAKRTIPVYLYCYFFKACSKLKNIFLFVLLLFDRWMHTEIYIESNQSTSVRIWTVYRNLIRARQNIIKLLGLFWHCRSQVTYFWRYGLNKWKNSIIFKSAYYSMVIFKFWLKIFC